MKDIDSRYLNIRDIGCYNTAYLLSNQVWNIVSKWNYFEKDTLGKQFVKAVDSISANIAEGFGRYHKKEKVRFYQISKGSLIESIDWLNKARIRKLISENEFEKLHDIFNKLPSEINHLIKYTNQKLKVLNNIAIEQYNNISMNPKAKF